MDFKFKTEVIDSFLGDCLIIKDTVTNKNVELMRVQAESILKRYEEDSCCGSFPHGGYDIYDETVVIYHDSDRDNHEIEINIDDLKDIVKKGKGVKGYF